MSASQPVTPAYLWFDTEFTSLDPDKAQLLQVALLVTDHDLARKAPIEDDLNLAVALDTDAELSPWVAEHLRELVATCRSEQAVPLAQVDAELAARVDRVVGPAAENKAMRPVLAGNSVHADMQMVQRFLPQFAARLNYRLLDVSAIKIVWNDWQPGRAFDKEDAAMVAAHLPESVTMPGGAVHDAYYDIHASLAELNYYREHLFSSCEPAS